ncbi:MAG: Gldg family protein [Candidatus Rifleibacteriota bacterium]
MSDRRKLDIPLYPYLILILGLVCILVSGLVYLNFPSEGKATIGILAGGITTVALAFLLLPEMYHELIKNKRTLLWVNDLILVIIIIGIGVVLAHIGFRRNIRYDFTRNKMFSLSDQTIKLLRNLEKDVKVTAFYPTGSREEQMVQELLNEYKRNSDKLHVRFVDPFRDPMTVRAMNVSSPGTIVVQCESNRIDVLARDMIEPAKAGVGDDAKPKFKGEQSVTSAILNVTTGRKRKLVFSTGHGEASLSGYTGRDLAKLNELLIGDNFDVEEVNLVESNIPEDTDLVAIISPTRDFLKSELDKIRSFLKGKNGKLIIALDPLSDTANLEKFMLEDLGVLANHDVVVDPRGLQREYWTVAPVLTDHEALAPLRESDLMCIMFHCRSLTVEGGKGYRATDYLDTIENSWAKRNIESGDTIQVAFEEGKDARGPLKLAVALEAENNASGSKILVFGDSDFIANSHIPFGGNKDLFINSINWMLGQQKLISIRAKILENPQILLDENAINRIFTFCVIISPLFIVLLGATVFLWRRRA